MEDPEWLNWHGLRFRLGESTICRPVGRFPSCCLMHVNVNQKTPRTFVVVLPSKKGGRMFQESRQPSKTTCLKSFTSKKTCTFLMGEDWNSKNLISWFTSVTESSATARLDCPTSGSTVEAGKFKSEDIHTTADFFAWFFNRFIMLDSNWLKSQKWLEFYMNMINIVLETSVTTQQPVEHLPFISFVGGNKTYAEENTCGLTSELKTYGMFPYWTNFWELRWLV